MTAHRRRADGQALLPISQSRPTHRQWTLPAAAHKLRSAPHLGYTDTGKMIDAVKRLAYFVEAHDDPTVNRMPSARPDLTVDRLTLGRDEENWGKLARAHGYQVLSRTGATHSPTGPDYFVTGALIERCPNLLVVAVGGAGYDQIDVDACTRAGVIVVNQSGAGREAVAEHAFGFMIALSKKIGAADRAIRRSANWQRTAFRGNDLLGKTVGIVGLGQIGSRLVELCSVFKMTVLAYDPYLSSAQIVARGGVKVGLDELLERSDFVSLCSPLSNETSGMFGAREFAKMRRGAFFVTTARGGVHIEKALVEALSSGHLGGAGLDVFEQEPPAPDNPLFGFDNVLATPHTAGITVETSHTLCRACAEQWVTTIDGQIPPRLINPAAWPRYSDRYEELLGRRPERLPHKKFRSSAE